MFLTEYYEIFRFFIHRHAGAALLDLFGGKVQHLFRLRRKIERMIKAPLAVLHIAIHPQTLDMPIQHTYIIALSSAFRLKQ